MQLVADNVDHDIQTIDVYGTLHGMGIIACITPKIELSLVIPCIKVTAQDFADVGHINIVPFIQKSGDLGPCLQ